ncbi:MAG: hypothetical protein HWN68_00625 [Desulfobacterales bacterium]|nr:hypothetical protein [Desulfobacterales bacterium]
MQIPKWLSKRPISRDDPLELRQLFPEDGLNFFSDISIEAVKEYYHLYPGNVFYGLIRILGFCGVQFYEKLSAYSGPLEPYPDVLCISPEHGQDRLSCILHDTNWTPFFRACGIRTLKQLHGVPVESFIRMSKQPLTPDQVVSILPATITTAHDDFFVKTPTVPTIFNITAEPDNQSQLEESQPLAKYCPILDDDKRLSEPVESLQLSVRSVNCLHSNNIHYIGELLAKRDEELIAIPHIGKKSFQEIKDGLFDIGLYTGLNVEIIIETREPSDDENVSSRSVDTLNLSVRSRNCLKQANIRTISELQTKTDKELFAIRNFGRQCLREIRTKVRHVESDQNQNVVPRFILKDEIRNEIDLNSKETLAKLCTKISDLVLSTRSRGCLKKQNIEFIWQIVQLTEKELQEVRNLGRKSINEIKGVIENLGLSLCVCFTPEQLSIINSYKPTIPKVVALAHRINRVVLELSVSPLTFLNDRENIVVSERLFKEGRKKTLEEIAKHISLTRERVRQIELSAISKIKQKYIKNLRIVVSNVKQLVDNVGGVTSLEELDVYLTELTAREQTIVVCLLQIMDEELFIDWEFGLVSTNGEELILSLCDVIQEEIIQTVSDKFFTEHDLVETARKVMHRFGLSSNQCEKNLINRFYLEKKVTVFENRLCCGRITKQDQIVQAFKEFFPDGLEVYKKQDVLVQRLKESDPKRFGNASPRSILGRLIDHPEVLLWGRGFFIHKDNVFYKEDVVKKVAIWIERRFDQGHSRFQIDIPFSAFRDELLQSGVPNQYALYTLIRLQNHKRIGQRRFPTLVDLEADVDIQEGVLQELENFFLQAGGPIPLSQLKEEFLVKRGWKDYMLQLNLTVNSELIYPWKNQSYIHIEYIPVDYAKLQDVLEALRVKLNSIQGAYSLKGSKKEMNVLWEQACPSASVRTMIKLIRSVDPEDLQIERYFVQFADSSTEFVSPVAELEEFFLNKGVELNTYELHKEFCTQRGWSENQLYGAIRKARLFRSGKSTYLHPATIGWNESLSQEVHQVMEAHLSERNKNCYPHMQIEELIYQYALPELPQNIQWTRYLMKSVGEEFGDFLFLDDAYVAVDNDFDIEDLDDMIGFLIGCHFRLGIAKRVELEQMLWREGILESGRSIPADQYFEESSIVFLEDSDEVGLSPIGYERYGHSI